MGRNSQQRRAAKQRKESARERNRAARPQPSTYGGPRDTSYVRDDIFDRRSDRTQDRSTEIIHRLIAGARVSYGPDANEAVVERAVDDLCIVSASVDDGTIEGALTDQVEGFLGRLWESGWQPSDIAHVVRRSTNARTSRLTNELVAHSAALQRDDRPTEWDDQLDALGAIVDALAPVVQQWQVNEGHELATTIRTGMLVIGCLATLPKISPIIEPPSRWGRFSSVRRPASPGATGVDSKTLAKIRGLLAKAEATEFAAEAESFSAKAQELMARYAIDAAMVQPDRGHDALAGEVRSRRIHIDDPYGAEKAQLVGSVASVNQGRVVWDPSFSFATVVGFPVDLDLIELLFTSLLVQVTRAMSDAAQDAGHTRSRSFRRAFLIAYAGRIRERLLEARQYAQAEATTQYGTALVPVLAARIEAVDDVTDDLFPQSRPMRTRTLDARGYYAGRAAADIANIETGSGMIDQRQAS